MEPNTVTIDDSMLVSWNWRLLNLIIDLVVVIFIFFFIGIIGFIFSMFGNDAMLDWMANMDGLTDRVFTTFVMVVYLFVMEFYTQRTVGKFVTGTMVVMEDGTRPEARAIMVRALCRIIGFEAFSFLRSKPRGWHDSAANTYVVDAKKYKQALELNQSFKQIGVAETE